MTIPPTTTQHLTASFRHEVIHRVIVTTTLSPCVNKYLQPTNHVFHQHNRWHCNGSTIAIGVRKLYHADHQRRWPHGILHQEVSSTAAFPSSILCGRNVRPMIDTRTLIAKYTNPTMTKRSKRVLPQTRDIGNSTRASSVKSSAPPTYRRMCQPHQDQKPHSSIILFTSQQATPLLSPALPLQSLQHLQGHSHTPSLSSFIPSPPPIPTHPSPAIAPLPPLVPPLRPRQSHS